MGQVYGAGGKTAPKRGRLGTGSYWPENGTPIYQTPGTIFPGITVEQPDFHQTTFGDPSRAGIATVVGQNRVRSIGTHPFVAQYNIITLPLVPARQVSSPADGQNLQPIKTANNKLFPPSERSNNSASGTKKKPIPFRTAFGASSMMPTDTAFKRKPGAQYEHHPRPKPSPQIEAQKKVAAVRTFAHVDNPLPVRGGVNQQQHRTPPPSFVSRNNIWYDPNNSFQGGESGGVGRWMIVKRGVVGFSRSSI